MLTPDITLDTTKIYSLVTQRTASSVRKNAAAAIDNPQSLDIGHEVTKSGIVNSVVYITSSHNIVCDTACNALPIVSPVKVQFKMSYNPTMGIAALDVELGNLRDQLTELINDSGRWTKLLNQES